MDSEEIEKKYFSYSVCVEPTVIPVGSFQFDLRGLSGTNMTTSVSAIIVGSTFINMNHLQLPLPAWNITNAHKEVYKNPNV